MRTRWNFENAPHHFSNISDKSFRNLSKTDSNLLRANALRKSCGKLADNSNFLLVIPQYMLCPVIVQLGNTIRNAFERSFETDSRVFRKRFGKFFRGRFSEVFETSRKNLSKRFRKILRKARRRWIYSQTRKSNGE